MQFDGTQSDEEENYFLTYLREQELNPRSQDLQEDSTQVLKGAEYVFNNSIDVSLSLQGVKSAASLLYNKMSEGNYSTKNWSLHELHPKAKDESTVDFIFTMDLLNFSFWSEKTSEERFAVRYKDQNWTGYWSLVAALQRALDEKIPITSPAYWVNEECTDEVLKHVFRSETIEEMPLLQERITFLREAGRILIQKFDGSFLGCINAAKNSAVKLVNLLASEFYCFNDSTSFEDEKSIRLLKRAQICVADLWAAFDGKEYGRFNDIERITIFADYRIPQILNTLGCLIYSPPLENTIKSGTLIESGHTWEIQIRGCSIWCVELIRKEIMRQHPGFRVNSIMIDFFLYDTIKEWETSGQYVRLPHHRTRSIWY